jgi:hypothetical protein
MRIRFRGRFGTLATKDAKYQLDCVHALRDRCTGLERSYVTHPSMML